MGWNLPPGVEVYDLPGNRPEDEYVSDDDCCPICEQKREMCMNCGECAWCHQASCTCPDFDEDRCRVQIDLDQECGNPATEIVREPYTPAAFEIRCCKSCADNYVSTGYSKG